MINHQPSTINHQPTNTYLFEDVLYHSPEYTEYTENSFIADLILLPIWSTNPFKLNECVDVGSCHLNLKWDFLLNFFYSLFFIFTSNQLVIDFIQHPQILFSHS
ncbi:hypothetical protein EYC80_005572 [Monilinia laxa]|uniref:Uncharacterized protein n=1 Tax=Monilinia laxa TaxID=61186 RepID=A0A5N6KEK9_MONLA|nr:hypothetical protein EYC80_005572 [Monilinia laxa]